MSLGVEASGQSGLGSGVSTEYNLNSTFDVVNVSYTDNAVGFYCSA